MQGHPSFGLRHQHSWFLDLQTQTRIDIIPSLVRPSSGFWAWTELPQWLSWFSSLQTAASETPTDTIFLETPASAITLHLIGFFRQKLPGSKESLSLLLEELAFEWPLSLLLISIDKFTSYGNFRHSLASSECYFVNTAVVSSPDSLYRAVWPFPGCFGLTDAPSLDSCLWPMEATLLRNVIRSQGQPHPKASWYGIGATLQYCTLVCSDITSDTKCVVFPINSSIPAGCSAIQF